MSGRGATVAAAAGRALAPVFGAVAAVRDARGLHPRGQVLRATLTRVPHPSTGAAWVDDGLPVQDVVVRLSRSAGLPPPWPDVLGLAVRVPLEGDRTGGTSGEPAVGDLLLSSAPSGPVVRHLLRPAFRPDATPYTCLVPFDTDRGHLMVGALPQGRARFALVTATSRSPWQEFAVLTLGDPHPEPDAVHDLDAVLHPLPGLRMPAALQRLREPSYARSREARDAS